jgi:hypothetical protein
MPVAAPFDLLSFWNKKQAVKEVQEAIRRGLKDREVIASDPQLQVLRSDPQFQKLLTSLKGK